MAKKKRGRPRKKGGTAKQRFLHKYWREQKAKQKSRKKRRGK